MNLIFDKYQHVEKLESDETEGIEIGGVFVFPKLDGTNASLWVNENNELQAGSRKRHLVLDDDNAGFCKWANEQENLKKFFLKNPYLRLYGEWLVTHTFKNYREDAKRKFYVFDVCFYNADGTKNYVHYLKYKEWLEEFNIDYIPCICILENPSKDQMYAALEKNNFLVIDGMGTGEGIVLKNYDYVNRFGHKVWAKIITSEFKERHYKTMGPAIIKGKIEYEDRIIEDFCTPALIMKEFEKIKLDSGWNSKMIPRLLGTVYHELIKEESWNFVKKYKFPVIDFSLLNRKVTHKIKKTLPELF